MAPKTPTEKRFWRCLCCGQHVSEAVAIGAFARGALGHSPEVLRQQFVGRGKGTGGGAVIWSRRPMTAEELQRQGLAAAKALEMVAGGIDEASEIASAFPEAVLASLDDVEASEVGQQWIADAEAELERRRRIVEEDLLRRRRIF